MWNLVGNGWGASGIIILWLKGLYSWNLMDSIQRLLREGSLWSDDVKNLGPLSHIQDIRLERSPFGCISKSVSSS